MKNTFAVTATLLATLVVGGSMLAYNRGTAKHHGAEAESHGAANTAGSHATTANTQPHETGGTDAKVPDSHAAASTVDGSPAGETPAGNAEPVSSTDAAAVSGATGATGEEPNQTATAAEPVGDSNGGQKTYAASCAGCHGAQGQGGVGPALTKEANQWTVDQLKLALREGKTPTRQLGQLMPRFTDAQLTDNDILNLHAFVKGL